MKEMTLISPEVATGKVLWASHGNTIFAHVPAPSLCPHHLRTAQQYRCWTVLPESHGSLCLASIISDLG